MVQMFDITPTPSEAGMLGQALGYGLKKRFPDPEQMVQRGLLQKAFDKVQSDGDFLQQLKSIAPTLLTTPGGSEALSTLAPLLQKRITNQALLDAEENLNREEAATQPANAAEFTSAGKEFVEEPVKKKDFTRDELARTDVQEEFIKEVPGKERATTFPEVTAGPEIQPLMTPQELKNFARRSVINSHKLGSPISYEQAYDLGLRQNEATRAFNETIQAEKNKRKQEIESTTQGAVARAADAGLIDPNSPEDVTVVQQTAYKNRFEPDPGKRWTTIRKDLEKWNSAKKQIETEFSLPNPLEKIGSKIIGTYKDAETVINDLQPALDKYREFGLINEARAALTTSLGFGPELTETALFPFNKEEKIQLSNFPKRPPIKREGRPYIEPRPPELVKFKGEEARMPETDFESFKNKLADFFEKNPAVNLISLRGNLNQEKEYAWQDISRAVTELINEERFIPNWVQDQQLKVINKHPLPGLASQFKFLWTGKK